MNLQKELKDNLTQKIAHTKKTDLHTNFESSLTNTNSYQSYLWMMREGFYRLQRDLSVSTRADPSYLAKLSVLQKAADKMAPLPGDSQAWHPKAVPSNLKVITLPVFLKNIDDVKKLTKGLMNEGVCVLTQSMMTACGPDHQKTKSRDWIAAILLKDEMDNKRVVFADTSSPGFTPIILQMVENGVRNFLFVDDGIFSGKQMSEDLDGLTRALTKSSVPKNDFKIRIYAVGCSDAGKEVIQDQISRNGFDVKLHRFHHIKRMGGPLTLHNTVFEHKIPDDISIPGSITQYLKKHIEDTPYKKKLSSTCDMTRPPLFLNGQNYDEMMDELSDVFSEFKNGKSNKNAKNLMAAHIIKWLKQVNSNIPDYKQFEEHSKQNFLHKHDNVLLNQLYQEDDEFERLRKFNLFWIGDLGENASGINHFRIALLNFKKDMMLRREVFEKNLKTAKWQSDPTKFQINEFEKKKPDYYMDQQSILTFVDKFMSLCNGVSCLL